MKFKKGCSNESHKPQGFLFSFFGPAGVRADMATVEQGCRGPSLCSWSTSSPLQCWVEGHMCSKLDQSQRSYKSGRPSFEKGDNFTIQSWTCPSLLNHLQVGGKNEGDVWSEAGSKSTSGQLFTSLFPV